MEPNAFIDARATCMHNNILRLRNLRMPLMCDRRKGPLALYFYLMERLCMSHEYEILTVYSVCNTHAAAAAARGTELT